ncbi:MAG: hypothetical protein NXY57DRAFT_968259 [Lentinula lateritia]|nr:MAG: hypothetical protein NXY57DRAFT_968259 [Lentinula lateritia]
MTASHTSTSVDALGGPPSSPNRRDSNVDEIVSNVEEPSLGQLSLFKSVFGVGVSLARYIVDDPLWSTLAAAGLPCPTCVRGKKEGSCSLVPHLARCSNCDDKKPCVLGRLVRFRYFSRKCSRDLAFARRFLEVHGDPGQRTRYSLPTEQWRILYDRVEQSTNSTSALLELNPLDDQDQRELDHQELRELRQRQPLVPAPSTSVPHTSQLAGSSSLLPPAPVTKKRKRPAKVDPGFTPKRRRPERVVDGSSPIAPPVPQVEGEAGYRRVVLVLRPPHVPDSEIPTLPGVGHLVPEDSSHRSVVEQSRSQGYAEIPRRVSQAGSFEQFVPPSEVEDFSRGRIKTPPVQQRSWEPMRPYPRSQASSVLRVENERLKAEVEELRTLLAQSRGEVSTLTSLLRDTSSSLDLRSQELEASRRSLEEVARDRVEYQRVLSQFQAIETELPEPASEDLVTRFHIAHSEVDAYREVAKRQKQEIGELHKQVDDASSRSSDAYTELDSANARALRQRDRLEELEEMVCSYRDRAHVAEGLIRQYPEDEGLYKVGLPSLSEVQRKLDASEALVRRLATFAHRLYRADPANLLHYHNRYVGGLLEAITLLLYRGLHHTPERLSSVVDFVLGYLSEARFTHGELHLRSTSSLLYYYSNAADRVDGLYQEMLTHSRFPSHDAFLTAAQHAGCVDARPGSVEPPLHRRFFSFDYPLPISPSPTSNHLPGVPAMDSIMVSWERLIANYIRDMIDTPGPHYSFPTSADLTVVGGGSSPLEGSVLAEEGDENAPRGVVGVTGEAGANVATPAEDDDRDPPVGGSETPAMARTPLFLPVSRSPSSPPLPPSVPVVPHIIDLTMIDDDGEDLYESREEFEARMRGDVAVKNERSSPAL